MRVPVYEIRSDYTGFMHLIKLAARLSPVASQHIEIDMARARWFDANMCAPFGAILYKVSRDLNTVSICNVTPEVETILSKNGFLCNYGHAEKPDTYGTTIPYKRFEPKDDRYFAVYIEEHLRGKGIPRMTPGLRKRFHESVSEIFSNAVIHSQTRLGIYCCGQFYPNKHRLDLSIADLGMGIRRNVSEKTGLDMAAEEAIGWAMTGVNTTKNGPVPGGMGLKVLLEFVTKNGGRLQVASDCGFWESAGGKVNSAKFPEPFPGTAMNLEINTADMKSYCLSSEIRPDQIF